ncbi:3-phosphoglycerate dehydrogenase [Bacillus sp. TS-2]|nr:3-phosphoglycerate dehydrogenase [Bacillus sp. TS-2]
MKIISSAKLKDELKKELMREFEGIQFLFFDSIEEAYTELKSAEILITYGEDLEENHIKSAKSLKWIMVISAGLEKMPFEAIEDQGILVTNCRGIHAKPMAEYTIHSILQTARKTKTLINNESKQVWDRSVPMMEISQKTLLILGVGAIGQEIARLAKAFEMTVYGFNSTGHSVHNVDLTVKEDGLDEVLSKADFVINVLPATAKTLNFMNKERFRQMKDSAVFINIGRGQTVDEEALMKALNENLISHAVLDVFKEEPLPVEHPLWGMEKVTITPHLSGISSFYQPRAIQIFKQNMIKYLNKEPHENYINRIQLSKGY